MGWYLFVGAFLILLFMLGYSLCDTYFPSSEEGESIKRRYWQEEWDAGSMPMRPFDEEYSSLYESLMDEIRKSIEE